MKPIKIKTIQFSSIGAMVKALRTGQLGLNTGSVIFSGPPPKGRVQKKKSRLLKGKGKGKFPKPFVKAPKPCDDCKALRHCDAPCQDYFTWENKK